MKLAEVLKSNRLVCGLPYAELNGMLQRISESKADGRERAIAICGNGNELSFPGGLGKPYAIMMPSCPINKEQIGSFHTHPSDHFSEKSPADWENDFEFRRLVSCIGYPTKTTFIEDGETKVEQKEIACHTFDVNNPEYEKFRDKFLSTARDAGAYNRELNRELYEQNRPSTDEEYEKYMTYRDAISDLVVEGKRKGIISDCEPRAAFGRFTLLDIEGMLAEQRRPMPGEKPKVMTINECDGRYTLAQLKAKAQAAGISSSGTKRYLCARLIAAGAVQ